MRSIRPQYFNPRSLAGATNPCTDDISEKDISIHAPLRERRHHTVSSLATEEFQSTLPCGSDFNAIVRLVQHIDFNPRSLAGATILPVRVSRSNGFQSTLPCGSDPTLIRQSACHNGFQSTLPCGSDRAAATTIFGAAHFNPRSLAGATYGIPAYGYAGNDFNPRSLAGATVSVLRFPCLPLYFNPRSLAGATIAFAAIVYNLLISIHAPLRERP